MENGHFYETLQQPFSLTLYTGQWRLCDMTTWIIPFQNLFVSRLFFAFLALALTAHFSSLTLSAR